VVFEQRNSPWYVSFNRETAALGLGNGTLRGGVSETGDGHGGVFGHHTLNLR
jgi:hypothetical protein